ncbi:FAD-dependent oxidoreductase [Nocardiopsis dassonvillei]|uniref:Fumarate reductase/succinate dehydrogenase flavoprotein domain protein n=1 Tax=Nocardiopsis dassonvillei (strain ATCC 23218 / DSM 43111 / CIP 107115 / JCM 7437 / KCTC 9190 / NBRC 14626 / NCTC 10488 / NRRL B-5397 / IMRU 509) TaxID=446468 RepID=D7AXM9_NOCDD|nr:FAD-dependent oxidoreductase [Nocardiopsis dassonvillei]ADH67933.1 fumarate reductase/succinate dehydrogenase flavoprotein domain protein [Nocardiopsis dassonvillei subsp. dassonvillei DSM 43111]NKY79312.1 FAD-dependent oxidoreductase [Nocardiopsis dassonvillei]VEI88435.1 putative FAD-binding dehydrogenase [Nocardiopsis dassonvillei]
MTETSTEILVVGGGLGGVAAALAAADSGRRVVLTEETDWIGGQLTAQAVPPDENPWIERFGSTASYRRLREGIRDHYRRAYPLRAEAASSLTLNPGAGRVSKLCHEPRVALAVLEEMVGPHRAAGRLTVLLRHRPVAAHTDGDRVSAVELEDERGRRRTVSAAYVLDATENGDLLPMAGLDHVTGAEARSEHGEPHAPEVADPTNLQGITYCFAMSHHQGEDHTIERPAMYDFWRSYTPEFWPGPLLGFSAPDPRTLEPVARTFVPNPDTDPLAVAADQSADAGDKELWGFRRILARRMHLPGAFDSDITLANWPLNDYWLKPALEIEGLVDARTVREAHEEARQLSLSVLYWLQTEAPRADGGTGFPGLKPRPDVTGTETGLAKAAYVRESRRIRAVTTVTEHDVSLDLLGPHGIVRRHDSVGVGSYRIDLHPSTGGDNYVDVASVPFEIPLGALLPERETNLLPAAKNVGTTHITNGCFRLHPVEWNIGEAAGRLAAFALEHGTTPHAVRAKDELLEAFTAVLDRTGVERRWPDVRGY